MHVIVIIHKIYNVKVGLNTKLTQSCSNLLLTLFMIPKFFKVLYSTYHKLNGGPFFFHISIFNFFNLLSCVYIKNCHFKTACILGRLLILSTWPCLHPFGLCWWRHDMVVRSNPNLVYFHKTNDQMPSLIVNFIWKWSKKIIYKFFKNQTYHELFNL